MSRKMGSVILDDTPTPAHDKHFIVDEPGLDLLTEEDHADLLKKAESQVHEDMVKGQRKQALNAYIAKVRQKYMPEEDIVPILMDLPGHCANIRLDGKLYWHSSHYDVTMSVYRSLIDVQNRAWQHEDAVGGVNRDKYLKPARNIHLSRGMENVTTSHLLRG